MTAIVGVCDGVLNSISSGDGFVATCSTPFLTVDAGFLGVGSVLDNDSISFAFGGCLLFFALGAGIGSVINVIRKSRL